MDLIFLAIIAGAASSLFGIIPAIALGILYNHGKYLPIWLPELGALGAYIIYFFTVLHQSIYLGGFVAILICFIISLVLHKLLFVKLITSVKPLTALLVGIGLIQIFQSLMSMYGAGKSQHYPDVLHKAVSFDIQTVPIYNIDIIAFFTILIVCIGLFVFLKFSKLGIQVRLMFSNRELAAHYKVNIIRLDGLIYFLAVSLMVLAAALYGMKYDLQPNMLFPTGLTALVACIIAGHRHWFLAPILVLFLEIISSIAGLYPITSGFQRSIPYLVIIGYFIIVSLKTTKSAL